MKFSSLIYQILPLIGLLATQGSAAAVSSSQESQHSPSPTASHHKASSSSSSKVSRHATSTSCSSHGTSTSSCPSLKVKISEFQGPLLNKTLADLSILEVDSKYYAYATGHNGTHGFTNVPLATSPQKLSGWTLSSKDAMPSNVGAWTVAPHTGSAAGLWNPDVSKLDDGRYIMYYSAKAASAGKAHERCIGIAYSTDPEGPFKPNDKPFYCPKSNGAIGVGGLEFDGKRYVIFKAGSLETNGSRIGLFDVSPKDGATILNNKTEPHYIVPHENPQQAGWEGPTLIKKDSTWILLHTEGVWHEDYSIHYATSESIYGPFVSKGLLLQSGDKGIDGKPIYRPGGPDFIGSSNTEFMFFGEDTNKTLSRYMYYGQLSFS